MSFFKLGLQQAPERYDYECIIVGAGLTALTAALHMARYKIDVVVLPR